MFRELGYDLAEHCARVKGADVAVTFGEDWRRYFGLGNATGLGLVPFAFKHPRVLHAWVALRELVVSLLLQRFQLAMYGMDNFKPKSTDWLRVTLFGGAPRLGSAGRDMDDNWVLPARPGRTARPGRSG